MEISKKIRMGKNEYTVTGSGADFFEAIQDISKVKSVLDIEKCGICQGTSLVLSCHVTEKDGFKYTTVKCTSPGCGGTLNISENKKTHERYYKRTAEGKLDWNKIAKDTV